MTKVTREILDHQEPSAQQDPQDSPDAVVPMVFLVILDRTHSKGLVVMLVSKDLMDSLEQQVLQETRVSLELWASQVFEDLRVPLVNQVQMDHVVLLAHQDHKDSQDRQDSPALLALLDLLDRLDSQV